MDVWSQGDTLSPMRSCHPPAQSCCWGVCPVTLCQQSGGDGGAELQHGAGRTVTLRTWQVLLDCSPPDPFTARPSWSSPGSRGTRGADKSSRTAGPSPHCWGARFGHKQPWSLARTLVAPRGVSVPVRGVQGAVASRDTVSSPPAPAPGADGPIYGSGGSSAGLAKRPEGRGARTRRGHAWGAAEGQPGGQPGWDTLGGVGCLGLPWGEPRVPTAMSPPATAHRGYQPPPGHSSPGHELPGYEPPGPKPLWP
ncbi:basic proline-rich protein-like [Apus apus]|uniref:basic proline-rich protein-like n=1 Tax=Apus apus TaxID=8895 RepID=UPI0021F8C9D2|nr:basic proline-rich protein-like [Apus apus]